MLILLFTQTDFEDSKKLVWVAGEGSFIEKILKCFGDFLSIQTQTTCRFHFFISSNRFSIHPQMFLM